METRKTKDLKPNPLNPRGPVAVDGNLRDLAASIQEQGLLQPILITPDGLIVAGHRRVAACNLAKVDEVDVIVKELDEAAQIEIMLVENLQREELNPVQIGMAALELRQRGLSITAISTAIGMGQQRLKTYVTIAQFPKEIRPFYASGQLKLITVSALEPLSPKQQIYWANRGVNAGWVGSELNRAIGGAKENKNIPISDDDMAQHVLSGISEKLFALAERIDYYQDFRPIARQVNSAGHALVEALRKNRPRKIA